MIRLVYSSSLADPDLYMGVKREDFFKSLLSKRTDELLFSARAPVAQMKEELVTRPEGLTTGVPVGINVNKPPKNFRDAMRRENRQEWAEAYDSEYQGFLEHGRCAYSWQSRLSTSQFVQV